LRIRIGAAGRSLGHDDRLRLSVANRAIEPPPEDRGVHARAPVRLERRGAVQEHGVAVGAVAPRAVADREVPAVRDHAAAAARRAAEVPHAGLDPHAHLVFAPVTVHPDRVGGRPLVVLLDEPEVVVGQPAADRDLRRQNEGVDLAAQALRREHPREPDGIGVRPDLPGERDAPLAEQRDDLLRALLDLLGPPARVGDAVAPRERVGAELVPHVAPIDPLEPLALGLLVQGDAFGHISVHGASR